MPIAVIVTASCQQCGKVYASAFQEHHFNLEDAVESVLAARNWFIHGDKIFCSAKCRYLYLNH